MLLDIIVPFRFWRRDKHDWVGSHRAAELFLLATIFTLAMTPVFLGVVNGGTLLWQRIVWGILGILGGLSILFLWSGMWRYWVRLDDSRPAMKRLWFFILLVGFWYGSCLYYLFVYRSQVMGRER